MNKALLKQITSYKHKKFRDTDKVFVIEGEKMVCEALKSSFEFVRICANSTWLCENERLIRGIPYSEASQSELEKMSNLTCPDKVIAVLKQKNYKIPKTDSILNSLSLMLDQIKNPGNMGTIIRLASWFGIKNIICSSHSVEYYNPKVVQASMGAIFHTNTTYCNIVELLDNIPKDFDIYATVVSDGKNIYEEKLSKNGIIIVGNESCGVSEEVLRRVNNKITIPSFNDFAEIESLNASMATAIILSEFKRRIKKNT